MIPHFEVDMEAENEQARGSASVIAYLAACIVAVILTGMSWLAWGVK
jgi:hypothetical protein